MIEVPFDWRVNILLYDNKYENKNKIDSPIIPVSAEIFYEDGVPYMKYKGTTYMNNGVKVQIDIPKMSLKLSAIEDTTEVGYHSNFDCRHRVVSSFKREFFATQDDIAYTITTLSRTCSKADLEKELGYKLNLTD